MSKCSHWIIGTSISTTWPSLTFPLLTLVHPLHDYVFVSHTRREINFNINTSRSWISFFKITNIDWGFYLCNSLNRKPTFLGDIGPGHEIWTQSKTSGGLAAVGSKPKGGLQKSSPPIGKPKKIKFLYSIPPARWMRMETVALGVL